MPDIVRRTLLVDLDTPAGRWSARALEQELRSGRAHLNPVVWGELTRSEVDAAWRKLRQLSAEIEAHPGPWPGEVKDQVHSAHKALSFWRDVFPDSWWNAHQIGAPR